MGTNMTKLENLVNPEVMAQMISAKLPKAIRFTPFATIDNTLAGRAGNTITVPKFAYIGDAEDVAEGVAMGTTVLTASTTTATVKKAGKAVEITDEAALSGYGDPVGEAGRQLTMSIASKVDNDCYDALKDGKLKYDGSAAGIGYEGIVSAIDLFDEETDGPSEKVIFVNPKQITELRKDENFLSREKYDNNVIMTGEIGMIAGCRVVPSRKVEAGESGYVCPIVLTSGADPDTTDDTPALTIYMKRAAQVESDRDILANTTVISVDEHYAAVLSNDSKVVVATFKA